MQEGKEERGWWATHPQDAREPLRKLKRSAWKEWPAGYRLGRHQQRPALGCVHTSVARSVVANHLGLVNGVHDLAGARGREGALDLDGVAGDGGSGFAALVDPQSRGLRGGALLAYSRARAATVGKTPTPRGGPAGRGGVPGSGHLEATATAVSMPGRPATYSWRAAW